MCLTSCKLCQMILLKAMLKFEILSMLFLSMFLLLHLLLFALHYEICRTYASMSCLFCIHLNLCMDSIMMFAYVPYLAYLLGVCTCILLLLVTSFSIVSSTLHTSIANLIDNAVGAPDSLSEATACICINQSAGDDDQNHPIIICCITLSLLG